MNANGAAQMRRRLCLAPLAGRDFFVAIGDNALFIWQAYASCGSSQLTATIAWDLCVGR
ncbi:hypothetical protein [Mesorhizobium shangrilense]|uniref:Uncharacterized protein n=1 Tax=Mesorhizobium shangrilense TaxID=460060 RepID=A0ABV2D812_9HYPH